MPKPAFGIEEGVFYDKINGFVLKIGKKEANDSVIRDVIVYEQTNTVQDNFIMAKSGIMRVTADKRFLEFNLNPADNELFDSIGSSYDWHRDWDVNTSLAGKRLVRSAGFGR